MLAKYAMIFWLIMLLSVSVNSELCIRETVVIIHEESFDEHSRPTTIEPKYETRIETYNCDERNETTDDYTDLDYISVDVDVDDTSTEIITDPIDYMLRDSICDPPCTNGICVKDLCVCYLDYIPVDEICQPFCSEPCYNGTCVSPNYCECDPGYILSYGSVCEPLCSSGCQNGDCVAPETCECKRGYSKELIGLSNVCTPDCKVGHTKLNGICTPKCKACDNGKCTAPGVCTCAHGYKMNFKKLINPDGDDPACIPSCVKCTGLCIAPNTCQYDVTVPTNFGNVTFSRTVTMNPATEVKTTPIPTKTTTLELSTTDISDATSTMVKTTQPTTTSVKTIYSSTTTAEPIYPTLTSAKLIDLITTTVKTTHTTTTLVKNTLPTAVIAKITTTVLDKKATPSVTSEVPETTQAFANLNSPSCDQDAEKQTWVEKYGTFILWPILALAIAVIIILLVWRRKSVVYFFIGKNYVVNDKLAHNERFSREVHYNKKNENVDSLKELI